MSHIQPQTNNYFGFIPVDSPTGTIVANSYLVSSSETLIAAGDVVVMSSKNTVKSIAALTGAFVGTSSASVLGVAAHAMAANTGSTAALLNSASSALLMVYDSPIQRFVVCDTTSGVIGSNVGQYKNYTILATGCVGSTGPSVGNQSNMAISGVTSTVAGAFHVHYMHPIEQGIHSTVGAATAGSAVNVRKWIGQFVSQNQSQVGTAALTVVNTTS